MSRLSTFAKIVAAGVPLGGLALMSAMSLDLAPYKQNPATTSDANKLNNAYDAMQAFVNALPPANISGYPADATKFLRGDASWAVPATSPIGVLMDYTVTGSPVAIIDTNTILGGNIPQTYKHLLIFISCYTSDAGVNASVMMRKNAVTSGSYYHHLVKGSNGLVTGTGVGGDTGCLVGYVSGSGGGFGFHSPIRIDVPDYAAAHVHGYTYQAFTVGDGGAANVNTTAGSGLLGSTTATALTRLQWYSLAGGSFVVGSRWTILGVG